MTELEQDINQYAVYAKPACCEIETFVKSELAMVLDKAQRQLKTLPGETFIEEGDMVINGFFDEEIMPKVDALEKTTIDRIN